MGLLNRAVLVMLVFHRGDLQSDSVDVKRVVYFPSPVSENSVLACQLR